MSCAELIVDRRLDVLNQSSHLCDSGIEIIVIECCKRHWEDRAAFLVPFGGFRIVRVKVRVREQFISESREFQMQRTMVFWYHVG